ncbi:MAG: transketolase C-terminal domain-containing protein, partial [Aminobacteriaceae bacterium]
GGLGEAVAALTGESYPVPVKAVAVFDKFGQSGTPQELKEYYGLTASQIVSEAMQAWIMRRR